MKKNFVPGNDSQLIFEIEKVTFHILVSAIIHKINYNDICCLIFEKIFYIYENLCTFKIYTYGGLCA